ncbi:MAG: hypothetical protein INQ03_03555 [Candidatus Heimdallarchaeota archaeon]|nr:hypothetical protein [Candidatus Heimdallarchaeota archaeon]
MIFLSPTFLIKSFFADSLDPYYATIALVTFTWDDLLDEFNHSKAYNIHYCMNEGISWNAIHSTNLTSYIMNTTNRVTIIGERTGGGGHAGGFKLLQDGFYLWISTRRAINPITGTNWEGTGILPHIEIERSYAFTVAYKMALEKVVSHSLVPEEVKSAIDGLSNNS